MEAILTWEEYVPDDIKDKYEIHDYHHAMVILHKEYPNEFNEIVDALRSYTYTRDDIIKPGGNESDFPKNFSALLHPLGWEERQLRIKFVSETEDGTTEKHNDTHKIDFVKNRVAIDFEWNSKDQTFDRDLYAFRAFFEFDRISVGVIITRGSEMADWFKRLGETGLQTPYGKPLQHKYGASTTHMGKLLPRLEAGRNGGCPVVVFGIRPLVENSNE
jgi:CRISPR-associated protein Csd2